MKCLFFFQTSICLNSRVIELVTWKNSELDASTSQEAYIVILEVLGDGSGKAKRNNF